MSKGKKIALWMVSILLALIFFWTGSMKLVSADQVVPIFVRYGYPARFTVIVGVCEFLGALGLLLPHRATLAATGLSIIMVGAFFTHITHHEFFFAVTPLLLLGLLVWVARTRMTERRAGIA